MDEFDPKLYEVCFAPSVRIPQRIVLGRRVYPLSTFSEARLRWGTVDTPVIAAGFSRERAHAFASTELLSDLCFVREMNRYVDSSGMGFPIGLISWDLIEDFGGAQIRSHLVNMLGLDEIPTAQCSPTPELRVWCETRDGRVLFLWARGASLRVRVATRVSWERCIGQSVWEWPIDPCAVIEKLYGRNLWSMPAPFAGFQGVCDGDFLLVEHVAREGCRAWRSYSADERILAVLRARSVEEWFGLCGDTEPHTQLRFNYMDS